MRINSKITTTALAALGGGAAAIVATLADPQKYRFPQDLGSGKMWPYFLTGIGLTLIGKVVHSQQGQKILSDFKDSQAQLDADKQTIEDLKAQIKGSAPRPEPKREDKPK
jgi:hypothetical protein